jgi:histidine triad (HIT) family protein
MSATPSDCLFCKIINGQIPAKLVHQDELTLGFLDIAPQAPTHVLFVPRRHVASLNDTTVEDRELLGHLVFVASKYAREQGISESGYRQVINCNRDAGQTVFHVHLHLLGGRSMTWPPG